MSEPALSPTPRTTLGRLRERGRADRRELYAILDAGLLCHLGVVVDGMPMVVPTGYGRRADVLYLHGSVAARSLRAAGAGAPVCVTVTHVDAVVVARSIFHHSMNYRSAMIYGTARRVTAEAERLAGLEALAEQLAPGSWAASRPPTRKELAATELLAVPLGEASVKVRQGPPADDEEDYAGPWWAGLLPLRVGWGEPVPDPRLAPGVGVPAHVIARAPTPDSVCGETG